MQAFGEPLPPAIEAAPLIESRALSESPPAAAPQPPAEETFAVAPGQPLQATAAASDAAAEMSSPAPLSVDEPPVAPAPSGAAPSELQSVLAEAGLELVETRAAALPPPEESDQYRPRAPRRQRPRPPKPADSGPLQQVETAQH